MTDHDRQEWIGARRVSRRVVLQGSAVAGATAFLAACGTGGGESASPAASASGAAPTASEAAATAAPPDEPLTGPLNFANWPAYIDLNEDETASPTLVDYTAKYGVEVNYSEEIDSQRGIPGDHRAPARSRSRHGLGPHGPDRLHGRPAHRQAAGSRRSTRPRSRTRSPTCARASRARPGIRTRRTTTPGRRSPMASATTGSARAWT